MRPSVLLDSPDSRASPTDSIPATIAPPKRTPSQTSSSHTAATHATAARSHPISFFMMSGERVHGRSPAAPAILTTGASPQQQQPQQQTTPSVARPSSASAPDSFKMPSVDTESSTYGVQSLEEAMSVADGMDPFPSTSSAASSPAAASPAHRFPRPPSVNTLSMPLTPVFAQSPALGAYETDAVSTPRSTSLRSFRLEASDDDSEREDDSVSQAIASSSDEEAEEGRAQPASTQPDSWPLHQGNVDDDDGAPQLVMPSVTMPQRRPFTDRGRQLGKMKILIAGAKQSGKTTLIKSIVQMCEDIVHVDPVQAAGPASEAQRESPRQQKRRASQGTAEITEIYASTKAYPTWWSEIEESRLLRRRKSFNDTVLERNICFVDTPGYDDLPATVNASDAVVRYVERFLHRSAAYTSMSNSELLNLLAGNGGVQVDLVLFCISRDPSETELSLLRRLALLTNVIPIITKTDLLSSDETTAAKSSVLNRIRTADIQPFLFGRPLHNIRSEVDTDFPPYAVSSALAASDDTMDASLLMSPDYRPPLHASDLETLLSRIFDPSTASWLRHSAAKKFLSWRRTTTFVPPSLSVNTLHPPHLQQQLSSIHPSATTSSAYTASSVIASSLSPSAVLVSNNQQLSSPSHPTYTLSRLADHTQREERLAQVRLARWASDLQRALRNERERFAALQDVERQRWLRERLGETVSPAYAGADAKGALITMRDGHASSVGRWKHVGALDPRDPLGLLAWEGRVRWRLSRAATLVGGAGLVGAVVVWCVRYLEWHASLQRSMGGWSWWEGSWSGSTGSSGGGAGGAEVEGGLWTWGRLLT